MLSPKAESPFSKSWKALHYLCCSAAKSCLTLCNFMDCRLHCPSLCLRVCSNSCPLSWWCYLTISSSDVPFSSFPQSSPASVSQLFTPRGQSIGASVLASVLPMNIQGCFPLGLSALTSLMSKGLLGLSMVFSSTIIWKHQFFSAQPSSWSSSHWLTLITDYWEDHSFCYMPFVHKVMSLLLDMLSRFVIDVLPRYKCL